MFIGEFIGENAVKGLLHPKMKIVIIPLPY